MLYETMQEVNNYFIKERIAGNFQIEDGQINNEEVLEKVQDGQYLLITGSVFNDGVVKYNFDTLTDESFKGSICLLKIPTSFIKLVEDIEKFNEENDKNLTMKSESFGGYSYTRNTDRDGNPITWQQCFFNRLNHYRKV